LEKVSESVPPVRIFHKSVHPVLDVFGPTVQFFVSPDEAEEALCVMRGVVPPGGIVPIHSHAGIECFLMITGQQEALIEEDDTYRWITCRPGDFIQVPGGAKHAFRNTFAEPAVSMVTTTAKLGRFFEEIGRPVTSDSRPAAPTPDELLRLMEASVRYGYWLAPPEENHAAGISLS
jgi:quercetin dioxygenase-like cupin family protein